jgi:3-keto-5-aminohexanoate cleavage enzyme
VALALHAEGLLEEPLQFSLVLGVVGGMAATPGNIVSLVARIPEGSVWQAIGIGRGNLAMTAIGLAMGGNARTGMEDTLMLRRGVQATSNAELVERLVEVARSLEREVATVADVEGAIGLAAVR